MVSSDEEAGTSSTRRGRRRQAGGTLRRRRGDIEDNADSSDGEDNASTIEDRRTQSSQSSTARGTASSNNNDGESVPTPSSPKDDHPPAERNVILEDPDPDTLRIMLSTDNHLGYAENDTVRGNDSFAALEEVLYLAKEYRCDMVLLAGDLFHENRPSRRTLIKTMDIFRRYCMGPGAIQVQVVSSKQEKSPFVRGYVNYEDEHYSVDLPVFSIHGNHDDPSRDGGNSELYAALDLLDVANLVNYFGKQEDTQNIRVDPILLEKGSTKVALYGLGSMRDERLNRMWKGDHLTFTRPTDDAQGDEPGWFNIFALHQNRDKGRGAKNCIKEDMIPDWIDFVCWGHEHECDIELTESVVGTFRISQPGSSVATSLVEGESLRKKIGVLDVREGQFRLTAIPLTQVRSFETATIRLADQPRLDPDDPKVDAKVSKILEDRVRILIHDAREKRQELLKDAQAEGNGLSKYCKRNGQEDMVESMPLKHIMYKEDEVLVRLKVDHTGFSAVNNQRFGAKFVGDIANPTDILLFTRKKSEGGGHGSKSAKSMKDIAPIEPSEIEEMNIEELIVEQFESSNTKLELFDDKKISSALDSYVGKQEAQAINEALEKLLGKQQNRLIQNGALSVADAIKIDADDDNVKTEKKRKGKSGGKRGRHDEEDVYEEENDDESMAEDSPPPKSRSKQKPSQRSTASRKRQDSYDDDEDEGTSSRAKSKPQSRSGSSRTAGRGRKTVVSYAESDDEDDDDDDVRVVDPPPQSRRKASPTRKRSTKQSYSMDDSEDDNDNDSIVIDEPSPPKKKTARGRAAPKKPPASATSSRRRRTSTANDDGLSQSQLSFQPAKRKTTREPARSTKSTRKTTSRKRSYNSDSDDEDDFTPAGRSNDDDDDDWGTAKSNSTF